MSFISSIEELEKIYGKPKAPSIVKVADHITDEYRAWINSSNFCTLATVGPEGIDASPRGDKGNVVFELDEKTLAMPDRRGNNRMDSLRNLVHDGRVSLMFLIQGSNTIIRINGTANISVESMMLQQFAINGQEPRSVILIDINEIYFQCARAAMRAGLWDHENWPDISKLPTAGDILQAQTKGNIDAKEYDQDWPNKAKASLW